MRNDTYDGQNPARAIWDAIDAAHELPDLVQRTTATLILRFGQRSAGWQIHGARQERPGPALDLTGGSASATLYAIRFPQRRSILERERDDVSAYAGMPTLLTPAFAVLGTITNAVDGEVSFALSAANTDMVGRYLIEPRVTLSGASLVPRRFKVSLLPAIAP